MFNKVLIAAVSMIISIGYAQDNQQDPTADQLAVMSEANQPLDNKEMEKQAFNDLPATLFPLSPDQIKTLKRKYNDTQRASSFTQDVPARPTSSSMVVDLAPGSTPPIVRLGIGFVTSLVFLDASGQPWPIKGYDIGNPNAFNIVQPTSGESKTGGNTLLIQSSTMYKQGNLAVILQGMNTPVMITLLPGQQAVDYRVDMQIPRTGPNALSGSANSLPSTINAVMMDILNHLIPKESKELKVENGLAESWLYRNKLYVRTPLTLISPGWTSKVSGADGTIHVYEISDPISKLILLDGGEMKQVALEGV
jgi:intracellular multiplication protein IcmK